MVVDEDTRRGRRDARSGGTAAVGRGELVAARTVIGFGDTAGSIVVSRRSGELPRRR